MSYILRPKLLVSHLFYSNCAELMCSLSFKETFLRRVSSTGALKLSTLKTEFHFRLKYTGYKSSQSTILLNRNSFNKEEQEFYIEEEVSTTEDHPGPGGGVRVLRAEEADGRAEAGEDQGHDEL